MQINHALYILNAADYFFSGWSTERKFLGHENTILCFEVRNKEIHVGLVLCDDDYDMIKIHTNNMCSAANKKVI